MARKIIWSNRAREDRKAILSYWNNRNKSNVYSKKLNWLFKETISFLSEHPQIGRKTILENIHVKVVRDYLIIYEVTEFEIVIHTIWDGRRNPSELGIS
jgi:addiction module RelE/StbE family toxin